jgi:hypothetical protein
MTHLSNSFFVAIAFALAISRLQATGAQIFSELHDLNRANDQLAEDIAKYLNSIVTNMAQSSSPLNELLGNFSYYLETVITSPPVFWHDEDFIRAIKELFARETSNILNNNNSVLIAECQKIFRDYAIQMYAQGKMIDHEFVERSPIIAVVKEQIAATFKRFIDEISTNSRIITRVDEKAKVNLKVTAEYKHSLGQYIKFKKNPIDVLIDASEKLIDRTNETAAEVEDKLDALNDRVFEYVKAISIIGQTRNQPWTSAVIGLVDRLKNQSQSKNKAFQWNVKLIRRILDLLRLAGYTDDSMKNFLDHLYETDSAVSMVDVRPINHKTTENKFNAHSLKIKDEGMENKSTTHAKTNQEPETFSFTQGNDKSPIQDNNLYDKNMDTIFNKNIKELLDNNQNTLGKSTNDIDEQEFEQNKIGLSERGSNLVHVIAGELTSRQYDIMTSSRDVIRAMSANRAGLGEHEEEFDYVHVRIVRSDSPCYDEAIKNMDE